MQTTRHRGGRSSGVSQLLFVGVLAMLGTQTMAEDKFKGEAYDCSQPMNIKMFDREAHCRFNPGVEGVPEKVSILQHVNSQTVDGYKCQVTSHRNMYYCGMFLYSKPILSAEQEQTLVITAQSCAEMARTRQFVTPQGRKTETLVVLGRPTLWSSPPGSRPPPTQR